MPVLAADMPPAAIICRERKPDGAREYWQWRQIDGRSCWYPGRTIRPKYELRWPQTSSPRPAEDAAPELEKAPHGKTDSGAVVPMTMQGSFEDRWLGLEGCRPGRDPRVTDCRPRQ